MDLFAERYVTSAATISSPPGSYAITQGSLAANANYTISFTGATLAVATAGDSPNAIYLPIAAR
jgi:hypothetical protein